MRRDDNAQKTYFRSSERVFRMNELWYFASREGDRGPFVSERQAQDEMAQFVLEQTELSDFQQSREKQRQPVLAGVNSSTLTLEDHRLARRAQAKRAARESMERKAALPPREVMI